VRTIHETVRTAHPTGDQHDSHRQQYGNHQPSQF
jgi:hypothetical protein